MKMEGHIVASSPLTTTKKKANNVVVFLSQLCQIKLVITAEPQGQSLAPARGSTTSDVTGVGVAVRGKVGGCTH